MVIWPILNNWLKNQYDKRRPVVGAAVLFLSCLLAWGIVSLLFSDSLNTDPFVCQLLFSMAIYYTWNAPLLILALAIVGLFAKDKATRIWSSVFIALDLFPLFLAASAFGGVVHPIRLLNF